jgi:hypothetical protein
MIKAADRQDAEELKMLEDAEKTVQKRKQTEKDGK